MVKRRGKPHKTGAPYHYSAQRMYEEIVAGYYRE
jgi:hypothetical protein